MANAKSFSDDQMKILIATYLHHASTLSEEQIRQFWAALVQLVICGLGAQDARTAMALLISANQLWEQQGNTLPFETRSWKSMLDYLEAIQVH